MGLFKPEAVAKIQAVADRSKQFSEPEKPKAKSRSSKDKLNEISKTVMEYFKDSEAILISSAEELHNYIDKCIEFGFAAIDTETTGLDRIKDHIVGASLYVPGMPECYIPCKHLVPVFDEPYKHQLTYEECGEELRRAQDAGVKFIYANADFDLSMIYNDFKVDLCSSCYYDVILAWRCLKENEPSKQLKTLYNKYILKGEGDPKQFTDFFPVDLFPYCTPSVAKYYAANDAKITYELYMFQLPYVTKTHPKCKKHHLEKIADLVWNIEFPLITVCQMMHRRGVYLETSIADKLVKKYDAEYQVELKKLQKMVQDILDDPKTSTKGLKRPFTSGSEFNPDSIDHVRHLLYDLLKLPVDPKKGKTTRKEDIAVFNLPVTAQIAKVRSVATLISTFVEKLPKSVAPDGKIHCRFNSIGADTGRFSSADPNMQNIPSGRKDIRRMFRATPGYVMMSSDYSAQEPRITAYVSQDEKMIKSFQEGKDIYGSIASVAFEVPYEECLEFHPVTGEYQPHGKKRRSEAKSIVLGICYGRSVTTIADQLYGKDDTLTSEEKVAKAQNVFDSVLMSFPALRSLMNGAQAAAKKQGYVETILGRRRHIPDMQLPPFEFKAASGYVNPDVDPLDINSLNLTSSEIPERIVAQLEKEFAGYKYYGQIAKRTKELQGECIKVINNTGKIADASRKCVNSIIQGSAAEQTKMAMLLIEANEEWKQLGGRLILPVHDELIAEIPMENYERGAELLSQMMCDAANFLPFDSKCDVEITYRWYGLSYPCKYPQASSIDTADEGEIKWIQYHLFEAGYELPEVPHEDGSDLRGDEALGISGKPTQDYEDAINDYMSRYNISKDQFLDHIHTLVHTGQLPE